tara:strand:- start:29 stop:541 length:513 start_codon:yes stop_codon:yes gene_type:complete
MNLSKEEKDDLKQRIKYEENYREPLQEEYEYWESIKEKKELGEDETILDIDGPISLTEVPMIVLENKIDALKKGIKVSIWKEKFIRYIYNNDKPNSIKYHNKLNEIALEDIERLRELSEEGKDIQIINDDNDNNEMKAYPNNYGFIKFSEQIQKAYNFREGILKWFNPNL